MYPKVESGFIESYTVKIKAFIAMLLDHRLKIYKILVCKDMGSIPNTV